MSPTELKLAPAGTPHTEDAAQSAAPLVAPTADPAQAEAAVADAMGLGEAPAPSVTPNPFAEPAPTAGAPAADTPPESFSISRPVADASSGSSISKADTVPTQLQDGQAKITRPGPDDPKPVFIEKTPPPAVVAPVSTDSPATAAPTPAAQTIVGMSPREAKDAAAMAGAIAAVGEHVVKHEHKTKESLDVVHGKIAVLEAEKLRLDELLRATTDRLGDVDALTARVATIESELVQMEEQEKQLASHDAAFMTVQTWSDGAANAIDAHGKRLDAQETTVQELRKEITDIRTDLAAQMRAISAQPAETPADFDARVDARLHEILSRELPGAIETAFVNGSVYINIGSNAAPSPTPEENPAQTEGSVIDARDRFGQPASSPSPESSSDLAAAA